MKPKRILCTALSSWKSKRRFGWSPRALLFFSLAFSVGTQAAHPLDLIGRRPKPFVEPDGYYQVILPAGFDCQLKAKQHLECQGKRNGKALLTIQVLDVPESATPELVALNEMKRFRKKPHFKELSKAKTVLAGEPAMTVSFSYDHLGNVELSAAVQALYTIRESKLFVLHFESRLDQFATYAEDLTQLYATFRPAELDAGGEPVLDSQMRKARETDVDTMDYEMLKERYKGHF